MASSSEISKGARRRTFIPRVQVTHPEIKLNRDNISRKVLNKSENGKDSGLSSDSTTPTGGSPPPRQPKISISPSTLANSLLNARGKNEIARISSARTSRLLHSRSGNDSPRSQDSVRTRQVASPFRPVFAGNGQSPSLDSGDEGSPRLERVNYHQDIVSIKTGLLKLMRVVQECGDNDLMRAETLNPFSNSTLNGLFHNLNDDGTPDTNTQFSNESLNIADEMADLRRQVIFLQGQVEDKNRTIQQLQMQVVKQQDLMNSTDSQSCSSSMMNSNNTLSKESCNAATQTEKIRPVSAGPSLLQSLPTNGSMGPLVSWSDSWSRPTSMYQRPPSLSELSSIKSPRKTSDRLPTRIVKTRPEHTTKRMNGDLEKSSSEMPICRIIKSRDAAQCKSDLADHSKDCKEEVNKPCVRSIPSLKKLTMPTFIPRVTRPDVSITGRLHNS